MKKPKNKQVLYVAYGEDNPHVDVFYDVGTYFGYPTKEEALQNPVRGINKIHAVYKVTAEKVRVKKAAK